MRLNVVSLVKEVDPLVKKSVVGNADPLKSVVEEVIILLNMLSEEVRDSDELRRLTKEFEDEKYVVGDIKVEELEYARRDDDEPVQLKSDCQVEELGRVSWVFDEGVIELDWWERLLPELEFEFTKVELAELLISDVEKWEWLVEAL